MKIINHERFKVSIHKSGKFYRKWQVVPHRLSMGDFRYWKDDTYSVQHSFVTECVQIFFLWFIIAFEMPFEKLGSSKYVRYESTHFAAIDETLQNT
jgi:hypothetical protein